MKISNLFIREHPRNPQLMKMNFRVLPSDLRAWYLLHSERLIQFAKFCLVGGGGMFVDMAVLGTLADPRLLGLNVTLSKICAAEIAMVNNFAWNELWTFRQSPAVSPTRRFTSSLAHRFLMFNLICGAGIGLAVLLLHLFYTGLKWNLYLSNLLSIVLVTFWNFGMNARFNWGKRAGAGE